MLEARSGGFDSASGRADALPWTLAKKERSASASDGMSMLNLNGWLRVPDGRAERSRGASHERGEGVSYHGRPLLPRLFSG